MSKTIQKLNTLKNPESFMQINTIKGFKYVDRAGEIVNAYHKIILHLNFKWGLMDWLLSNRKIKLMS